MAVVAVFCTGARGADDSRDAEFLAGLRSRGLYQLAEDYCLARLEQEDFPDVRRSEIVTELSGTLVERALNSPPEQREDFWRRAWEVTEQFAENYPDHARLFLVRAQGAMAMVARGELGRQEAEVLGDADRRREDARVRIRDAIRKLTELSEQVADALRERSLPGRQPPESPGALTVYQLSTLLTKLRYQLARAYRNQALCYPEDSADRADALAQALGLLDELAGLDPKDPLAWPSRIDEIVCLRLSKDFAAAARKLEAALALEPVGEIADRLTAERIRLDLADGKLAEAVTEANRIRGLSTPELDYARLEAALAAWQATQSSGQTDRAEQWQKAAMALSDGMSQAHGPYWSRRAKYLLTNSFRTSPGGGSLDMLAHTAESDYLRGQFGEAVATYDEASRLAREQQDGDRAFQYAFLAATIERQRGRRAEALRRYRELAQSQPGHDRAAEAHQLAIRQAAHVAQTGEAGSFENYVALLVEHLQRWPKAETADEVRWQLARVWQSQSQWAEAAAIYRTISPSSARFDDAIEAAALCYRRQIEQLAADGEPVAPVAVEAARWFESIFLSPGGEPPERWSPRARRAVLAAAEFWLRSDQRGFDRAEAILLAALSSAEDAPEKWRAAAQSLRVCALAGHGRRPEAAALLAQISGVSTGRLLTVLEGLARLAEEADDSVRLELANLQLQTIELLQGQPALLGADQLRTLRRLSARALRDAGRSADALAAYEQLAQKYPDDGQVQEELAGLLAVAGDRGSLERALARWRTIEKRSPPASERWFRAKYSIASLHERLGNPDQARRMITLLQLLHPDLGGPRQKARFLALLEQCNR